MRFYFSTITCSDTFGIAAAVLVILCSLAKIKLTDTIGPLIPYISILIADLVVMAFWPWLVMFLPTFFKL
jgi:TRAP-type C4-dicarboxylate transport system permease large subunit